MPATDWNARKMVHFELALAKFKTGEPHLDDLRECNRCELEALRSSGVVERVRILRCDDSCPVCLAVARRTMTIAEALASSPLPVTGCNHRLGNREGWCRCEYLAIVPE
jgi:hypothetical protein